MLHLALLSLCCATPLVKRSDSFIGEGLGEVAIDAPGLAYPHSWKGFPNTGVDGSLTDFVVADVISAGTAGLVPTGVNPSSCTPKDGEYPIILIPGTAETAYANWAYMGPKLAAEGYCVYSFVHNPLQFANNGTILEGFAFLGDITENAQALSTIVDQVLDLTGASQVDFVGHSQGAGALPFYYLKNLMSGTKVRKTIGLAPSLGTSFYGINELFNHILSQDTRYALTNITDADFNSASLEQQLTDSSFMTALKDGGYAVEGVEYINIATKYDEVLLPYTNCWFEEDNRTITNVLLQDYCELDLSDHIGLAYSSNAYQLVLNYLSGSDTASCNIELPVFN